MSTPSRGESVGVATATTALLALVPVAAARKAWGKQMFRGSSGERLAGTRRFRFLDLLREHSCSPERSARKSMPETRLRRMVASPRLGLEQES